MFQIFIFFSNLNWPLEGYRADPLEIKGEGYIPTPPFGAKGGGATYNPPPSGPNGGGGARNRARRAKHARAHSSWGGSNRMLKKGFTEEPP